MDDLKKLASQFAQAAQVAGPSSYIPEVTAYSRAGAIEGAIKGGISSGGAFAGQKAKEADEADEAARKAAAQKISNKLDPSKYQKVRKADGGFAFLDSDGKDVGIDIFAKVTGQRRVDILKDSENPIDQEYINDWSNMNTLSQAMYNGDQETINSFIQQNPELKDRKPEQLMIELIRKYPHLYNAGNYQQTLKNRGSKAFSFNQNFIPSSAGSTTGSGGGGWSPS